MANETKAAAAVGAAAFVQLLSSSVMQLYITYGPHMIFVQLLFPVMRTQSAPINLGETWQFPAIWTPM